MKQIGACLAGIVILAGVPGQEAASPTRGTAKSPDGVEIRYEVSGSGSPPVVFVHGWSCDRTYWKEQVAHFAASHRVIAVDLGGHGESGLGREDWTIEAFAADVRAVLEALDVRGAVLVGHSMGGQVIVEAAKVAPERVAALVAVDHFQEVDHRLSPQDLDAILGRFQAEFPAAADEFVREMFTARADSKLVDPIARDMAAAPPDVAISALENVFRYDEAAGIASVNRPMRLLNADKWPTDLEAARRHKPDVELAVMPRVGHFLMAEDPAEFNRLLARALRELTSS